MAIFKKRGYRLRLLSAAFRNHMRWSEFIGGEVVISPQYKWQLRYNAIDDPVDPKIVAELRTLRQFTAGCQQLAGLMRDFMMPNPDL